MPKYTFALLSGELVILLSLLPFIAPPEQVTWLRWRVGGIACGSVALIALAIQLYLQYREEKKMKAEQEKREKERDKTLEEILRRLPKHRRTRDSAFGTGVIGLILQEQPSLAERIASLAVDLYTFIRQDAAQSGYDSKLKPRLLELLPELTKSGIAASVSETELESTAEQFVPKLRHLADNLTAIAVRLMYPQLKVTDGGFLIRDEE